MSTSATNLPLYRRPTRCPISRWYLYPLAARLARTLAATRIRPWQVTLLGLMFAMAAAAVLVGHSPLAPAAALLVWAAWFCDRTDGLLARQQGRATAWGAWLDANVDELVDVGLHVAVAAAIASQTAYWLLIAFLAGKYLFMYGLSAEAAHSAQGDSTEPEAAQVGWLRRAYHLPGNADVRMHLLVAALLTGFLAAELAFVALYYNLRWTVRYFLVVRRLGGDR